MKVIVHGRDEVIDKMTGEILNPVNKQEFDAVEAIDRSDWTDDPKDGKAILLPDGRELLNPLPISPPVGFRKEPDILEQVAAQVRKHYEMLKDDDEIDTVEDANDFGEDEEIDPSSIYEVVMREEFPAVPVVADVAVPEPVAPAAPVQPVPVAPVPG